jgi:hypothetical protein
MLLVTATYQIQIGKITEKTKPSSKKTVNMA